MCVHPITIGQIVKVVTDNFTPVFAFPSGNVVSAAFTNTTVLVFRDTQF